MDEFLLLSPAAEQADRDELRLLKPESQDDVERVEARRLSARQFDWPQLMGPPQLLLGQQMVGWSTSRLFNTSESTRGGCKQHVVIRQSIEFPEFTLTIRWSPW